MAILFRLRRRDGEPRRWRFRLRTLLLVVLMAALGLGWLVRHLRAEREQVALVAELNRDGCYAWQYEPNSAGRALLLSLPTSANQWLVHRGLGWTFCYSPSRISAFPVGDAGVPRLIERMRRLPYLKSLTLTRGRISAEQERRVREALPGVGVDFQSL